LSAGKRSIPSAQYIPRNIKPSSVLALIRNGIDRIGINQSITRSEADGVASGPLPEHFCEDGMGDF